MVSAASKDTCKDVLVDFCPSPMTAWLLSWIRRKVFNKCTDLCIVHVVVFGHEHLVTGDLKFQSHRWIGLASTKVQTLLVPVIQDFLGMILFSPFAHWLNHWRIKWGMGEQKLFGGGHSIFSCQASESWWYHCWGLPICFCRIQKCLTDREGDSAWRFQLQDTQ